MSNLNELAAKAAMKKMMDQGWFSISTIDNILEVLGLPKGSGPAYLILKTIHCVDFAKLDSELREQIPHLIAEAIGQPVLDWSPVFRAISPTTKEVAIINRVSGWLK